MRYGNRNSQIAVTSNQILLNMLSDVIKLLTLYLTIHITTSRHVNIIYETPRTKNIEPLYCHIVHVFRSIADSFRIANAAAERLFISDPERVPWYNSSKYVGLHIIHYGNHVSDATLARQADRFVAVSIRS